MKQYPVESQDETLSKLISQASTTEFGKSYNFKDINTIQDFQNRVPLQTYENIKPWVDRLREGEKNLLWSSDVKWFAKSSGTTSDKSKFIPVTKEALEDCHFRGGKDVISLYHRNYPDSKTLTGKSFTLGGSHEIDNFSNQSYYGDLSAILIENLPFWVDLIRTPKADVVLIPKFEEKLEKIIETSLNDNVTSLAGVPSWTMVMIKFLLERTGKNNLLEIWPNLELFIHGGVSFVPYREQFKKLIPSPNMHYMETYNASEGFFAIQDDPDSDDMLLMLDYGIFYEFIPMNEFHKENPKVLSIGEVEKGVNYAMVITTNGGLWRYIIGDTVVFTSTWPFKIKISGRTRHFINAFGEEVIVDNSDKALKVACDKTGALISEYTVAPIFMSDKSKGSHEWVVEFDKKPDNVAFFTTVLDNALKSINSDYEAKRYNDITLEMPVLHVVEKGTFYQWFGEKGKVGGQNKMPRLSNDRRYVEELLAIVERQKNS
jgi:hypothetical protein